MVDTRQAAGPAAFPSVATPFSVTVTDPSAALDSGTDETYSLVITETEGVVILAATVYGAMHALTSLRWPSLVNIRCACSLCSRLKVPRSQPADCRRPNRRRVAHPAHAVDH